MRLYLLFSLLPFFLTAQSDDQKNDFWQRVRMRAGLALQFDGNTDLYYTTRINDIVPYYARSPLISGAANWTPIPQFPGFRTQVRLTYDNVNFFGDNQRIGNTLLGEGFEESLNYKHLQAATGLLVELFPEFEWSPYFSSHILWSIPLSIRYEAKGIDRLNAPVAVVIDRGAELSPGWESGIGMRAKIVDCWSLSIGVYYTQQAIIIDWPNFTGRNFRQGTVMRTHTFGCNITGLYSW